MVSRRQCFCCERAGERLGLPRCMASGSASSIKSVGSCHAVRSVCVSDILPGVEPVPSFDMCGVDHVSSVAVEVPSK